MRKSNTILYFLFVLLIMGAFASMAQNNYGLKLLAWVAVAFGIVFFLQLITALRKQKPHRFLRIVELSALTVVALIFALRTFYVRLPLLVPLFVIACLALIVVYTISLIRNWNHYAVHNRQLAWLLAGYYLSLILFLVSLIAVPLAPGLTEVTGRVAFVLLLIFLVVALTGRSFFVGPEKLTLQQVVLGLRDRSAVLLTLFLLISLYTGLSRSGFIPPLYTDVYPQAYFEWVRKAERREDRPVNGKFHHERFMQQYEHFLDKNLNGKP